jgi:hypothetical protein
MAQSLSQVIIHMVFSTKDRRPCLDPLVSANREDESRLQRGELFFYCLTQGCALVWYE